MTFKEWFNSAPHRTKCSIDHPAYLAAQEAWEAAHEVCAKLCEQPVDEIQITDDCSEYKYRDNQECADAIRTRREQCQRIES